MNIKNRLKELRNSKNLSQKEMSKIFGITQSGYSRWESGIVKIDNLSLQKIADYFNVTIDYILYNETKKIPNSSTTSELEEIFNSLSDIEKNKVKGYMQGLIDNRLNIDNSNNTYKSFDNNPFTNSNNNKITY